MHPYIILYNNVLIACIVNLFYLPIDMGRPERVKYGDLAVQRGKLTSRPGGLQISCYILIKVHQNILHSVGKRLIHQDSLGGMPFMFASRILRTCLHFIGTSQTRCLLISSFYCCMLAIYRRRNQVHNMRGNCGWRLCELSLLRWSRQLDQFMRQLGLASADPAIS